MVQFLSEEKFESDESLYSELLERFHRIPEQSDPTLVKIFSGKTHKNVIKSENIGVMLKNLLLRMDLRENFESLRNENSRAQAETVETMFEEFVSFVNSVVGNFLPWVLRGLGKLSEYGSEEAKGTNWSEMAKKVEDALSALGGETAADDSLVPVE